MAMIPDLYAPQIGARWLIAMFRYWSILNAGSVPSVLFRCYGVRCKLIAVGLFSVIASDKSERPVKATIHVELASGRATN
jgi:hypothetical protein